MRELDQNMRSQTNTIQNDIVKLVKSIPRLFNPKNSSSDYNFNFKIYTDLIVNSSDHDQMVQMCLLILVCTGGMGIFNSHKLTKC
jgi:hypothetical protein